MPFFQLSDIQPYPLVNGITIKGVSGDNISVSFLEFPPGAEIPPHRHTNEQIGIVEDGELQYTIGDHTMICRQGMAFLVPPNTLHSARVVSKHPVRLVDVFTPPRQFTEPLRYENR
jgi:quercetin dioxygenase-like cupin family protein